MLYETAFHIKKRVNYVCFVFVFVFFSTFEIILVQRRLGWWSFERGDSGAYEQ